MSFIGDIIGGVGDIIGATKKQKVPQQEAFRGLISTPAFQFGGGVLARRNQDFVTGQRGLRANLQRLRGQVRPGFGRLTESGVNAIRQRAGVAAGDLRANLARRGLLGASFATDLQDRVDQEFQQLENEFRTQAFAEELAATSQLIDQEQASLVAQAQQELAELGIATSFLSTVNQAALTQAEIAKQIAEEKMLAGIPSPEQIAAGATPPTGGVPTPAPLGPSIPRGTVGPGGGFSSDRAQFRASRPPPSLARFRSRFGAA